MVKYTSYKLCNKLFLIAWNSWKIHFNEKNEMISYTSILNFVGTMIRSSLLFGEIKFPYFYGTFYWIKVIKLITRITLLFSVQNYTKLLITISKYMIYNCWRYFHFIGNILCVQKLCQSMIFLIGQSEMNILWWEYVLDRDICQYFHGFQ